MSAEPMYKPNGESISSPESLIVTLNREVLNKPTDELTRNYTINFIKDLVKGYETKSNKKYEGFMPEPVRKMLESKKDL
jgi:hypothetical protein